MRRRGTRPPRGTIGRRGLAALLVTLGTVTGATGCETALSGWLAPTAVSSPASTEPASGVAVQQLVAVARVVDGDTLQLADGQRLRLLGVNSFSRLRVSHETSVRFAEVLMRG